MSFDESIMRCTKANKQDDDCPNKQDKGIFYKTDGIIVNNTADDRAEHVILHLIKGRARREIPFSHDIDLHDDCEQPQHKLCGNQGITC